MAEGLELLGKALAAYWTAPLPLAILAVCGASMATLLYVFVTNGRNPRLRVSLLTGFYALTMFFWLFVGVSLLLCVWQARSVAYRTSGVQIAAAGAVLAALAATIVISALVWRFAPAAVLRRFPLRGPEPGEAWTQSYADLLAEFEGLPRTRIAIVDSDAPVGMAVGGSAPTVLLSRGLLGALDRDEAETVIAHELMHIKHHDAGFKVFSRVLSRVLFFDPFSKFFDPAVHREREYLADEAGGRTTGKPAALASALLKIADRGPTPRAAWGLSILGPAKGVFSRYPPVRERVRRLLLLSTLLEGAPRTPAKP